MLQAAAVIVLTEKNLHLINFFLHSLTKRTQSECKKGSSPTAMQEYMYGSAKTYASKYVKAIHHDLERFLCSELLCITNTNAIAKPTNRVHSTRQH